jgi:hypothetical protein
MHDEKAVITGPDGLIERLLSRDNSVVHQGYGIICRAVTLTSNVLTISGDGQEGSADEQLS